MDPCPLQDGLAQPFFYPTRVTLHRGRQSVTPSRHNDLINLRLERVVLALVTQYVSGLYCLSLSHIWVAPIFRGTCCLAWQQRS